jgi:spermidine/putrescine-binding protein
VCGLWLVLFAPGAHAQAVLNLYTARHYQTDEALYANFTRQTGIKVNRLEGKEEELVERSAVQFVGKVCRPMLSFYLLVIM